MALRDQKETPESREFRVRKVKLVPKVRKVSKDLPGQKEIRENLVKKVRMEPKARKENLDPRAPMAILLCVELTIGPKRTSRLLSMRCWPLLLMERR